MLGRQIAVALRRPLQARLRTQTPTSLCIRTFTQAPQVLAGRPKKAVGEPSKPVKRAPKTTTDKQSKASDAAAKKKLAEKKKLAAKKAADAKKKKAKRELTPEEVEKRKARLQKAQVKELRKAVLPIPRESLYKTTNAYAEYIREHADRFKSGMANKMTPAEQQATLSEISRGIALEWKALSSSQHAHYNQLANATKEKSAAAYKRWVESHTVEEISIANTARRALNRLHAAGKIRFKYPLISDERSVKRPMTAWNQYFTSRMGSSDFSNVANNERAGHVSQEWKALDESEKKKFYDLASKDTERYVSEYTAVYGRAPKHISPQPAA